MKKASQYTVRNISPSLGDAIRRKAGAEGKSINEIYLEALGAVVGLNTLKIRHHDLDFLAGTWVEDAKVDAALDSERKIQRGDW